MKVYLSQERLNSGGYNAQGKYFGFERRSMVYRFDFAGNDCSGYVRASSRSSAKEQLRARYPDLKLAFFR